MWLREGWWEREREHNIEVFEVHIHKSARTYFKSVGPSIEMRQFILWHNILQDRGGENKHTVMTPVAALTPASPKIAVAASVTRAVAPMLTKLIKN
jgi:hypothetical protein